MFVLNVLLSHKENSTLEVKEAKNGLPTSIWETYSAFANTYGGIILLGVTEDQNKNLIPVGLTELEANQLVKSFWDTIHSDKVSINLLTDKNVTITPIEKSYIVIIDIPQATRYDKPIYLNNNIFSAYRRNHEGDYKCNKKEVVNMVRDNDITSQDSHIVKEFTIDALCQNTINEYRTRFVNYKGDDHPFSNEPVELFLRHIGAAIYDENNILHPTKAGLLMFGYDYDITTVFPNYFLDYQDKRHIFGDMRWINRIYSSTGNWSGNLCDFFFRITNKIVEDVPVPFKMEGMFRIDITPMHKAIRETLCNCLSNADFNETRGVVIKQYEDRLEFSNPGAFTMSKSLALSGGNSDARNKNILTMFNNINIGERTGSGIPLILSSAKEAGFDEPTFEDFFNPDYTKVTIYLNHSQERDKLEVKNNNLEVESNNLEVESNNLEVEINNLEVESNNLEVESNNLEVESDNLEVENKNQVILFEIKGLNIRGDLKQKLIYLFEKAQNNIFSNSSIVEILKCSESSAANYIKILLANHLIVPVKGHGKGKYKFK